MLCGDGVALIAARLVPTAARMQLKFGTYIAALSTAAGSAVRSRVAAVSVVIGKMPAPVSDDIETSGILGDCTSRRATMLLP
jgi:hypothetical protein